ncbi:MAG: HIT domain-containing protein [Nanoarchaeota archaeon]|jgi:histidine triad (HIT) family protein|nr:HIT domain-containing protein [Nanoarchaeota archaeon]
MDDCVYCKIANKILPSYILYEDNDIICVLDILPPSKGSFLIFPKLHIEDYTSLNDEINQKMFTISKYISIVLKNKLKFDGLNILLSSGETGQKYKHIVIQVIPRFKDDNIKIYFNRFREDPSFLEELKNYITTELIRMSQQYLNSEKKEEKKETKKDIDYKLLNQWFEKRI